MRVVWQGNYRLTLTLVHTPGAAGGAVPAWAGEGSVAIRSTVLFSVVEESATQIESLYEWQSVEAWQTVEGGASRLLSLTATLDDGGLVWCAGMEVTLPVGEDEGSAAGAKAEGNRKRARIPPRWQLQLYIEPKVGFLRVEVGPQTTLGCARQVVAFAQSVCLRSMDGQGDSGGG